jgi:hypothetical protein
MSNRSVFLLFLFLRVSLAGFSNSQTTDSTSFKLNSRLSFYSNEDKGEMLLHIPKILTASNMKITLTFPGNHIVEWTGKPGKELLRLPFNIDPTFRSAIVEAEIQLNNASGKPLIKYTASGALIILPHKPNEVKTDRLSGGLIVNGRQFFPFGFYCYSPVYPTLPEEEVVNGFNMISPYQKILPETLPERKAYMDRCAQLGMKVHYNLLSVTGGGGVNSKIEGLTDSQKKELLTTEIKTFMNHPALLAWYISDEPTGNKVSPETLEDIYHLVKETDPWHPVSIVFMAPFISARTYSDALDIVMADPYPVPNSPVSVVGDVTKELTREFTGDKPVWMVPQAFGGGELWSREPTLQEIRSMTWQSVIRGATGIQYFVRQGFNAFPKSPATWSECGRMALEIAELTPWLLSDEETIHVDTGSDNIIASSKLHNGKLIIMAVNRLNEPGRLEIRIGRYVNCKARVLFENRFVTVSGGYFNDQIQAFGSQIYMVDLNSKEKDSKTGTKGLIKDPGFEDTSSTGIPASCYAKTGGDRGATFFLDSRESFEGNHSLRIITPEENKSVSLRFFPFTASAGASYTISIWAKSDPEQRFLPLALKDNTSSKKEKPMPQYVEILLGEFGGARFIPDKEWRRYMTFITIPADTLPSYRTNLVLKMPGQGVAWFDQLNVFEDKR